MRLFMFLLIVAIAFVLTGGWFWLAVVAWVVYAVMVNVWCWFKEKARTN